MSFAIEMMVVVIDPFLSALHLDRKDDDFLDHLNHKAATCFMFVLLFVHTFYQIFLGQVIHCWTPTQFPHMWTEYTNSYCWSKSTYYVPHYGPVEHELSGNQRHIGYYQWVPYILCYMGMLSYIPGLVWYVGSQATGLNINHMVHGVNRITIASRPNEMENQVRGIARHVDRALRLAQKSRWITDDCPHKQCNSGSYCEIKRLEGVKLACLWAITKSLYIGSVAAQMYSLYVFMGIEYLTYGIDTLLDTFRGSQLLQLRMFPTVTICDFEIRSLAKNVPYTVQCNLPINIFNAKIFLVLWYWVTLNALLNIFVFLQQIILLFPQCRLRYIKNLLKSLDAFDRQKDKQVVNEFVFDYLRVDGYIAMRMIARNSTQVASAMLVKKLWTDFRNNHSDCESLPKWQRLPSKNFIKRNV